MASVYALVVAAGRGSRFGGSLPKQYLPLGGISVLRHAVNALAQHPLITNVLVAIRPEDKTLFDNTLSGINVLPAVAGGATRQDSVRLGLAVLASYRPDLVLIHDGARPFPDPQLVDRVIDGLDRAPAAIPCLPLRDTIKRAQDGEIRETIDRSTLWRAQTPQGFHFDAILAAHRSAIGRDLPDDAAVAEAAGLVPLVVEGSEENLKVTTPEDLAAAERLIAYRQGDIRVGQGFDVHPFVPGDHLWRGAASDQFLRHAAGLARARGGVVAAVDVTIICERPKISPHRAAMIGRIAAILGIAPDRVSVKATTTEKLGFTGRAEGIAAQAVATIRLP